MQDEGMDMRILPLLVILAGCGGDGTPPGASMHLGSREVPGGSIGVSRTELHGRYRITFAGVSVSAVSAGLDWPDASIDCTAARMLAPGIWEIDLDMPSSMQPGTVLRVRVQLTDGCIVESGYSDFAL